MAYSFLKPCRIFKELKMAKSVELFLLFSLIQPCSADDSAWGRTIENNFSEFDTLLTTIVLLLCIAGIFLCVWCAFCGHRDYFVSLDQRRLLFHQQALERAASSVKRKNSSRRKKKYSANLKGTTLPVTLI